MPKHQCTSRLRACAHIDNLKSMHATYCHIKACLTTLMCSGNCGDINLVRLGSERTISKSLKPFSLDHQTKARAREREIHAFTIQELMHVVLMCKVFVCRASPANCRSWHTQAEGATGPKNWKSLTAMCKNQEGFFWGNASSTQGFKREYRDHI